MEDPVFAEALQLFVQVCRRREIPRQDIVSADQSTHPWIFAGGIGEGWSFTLGADAARRFAVDTEGLLYNATRIWVLRKVPSWYQIREGGHHLVATSPIEDCDEQFRDELLEAIVKFTADGKTPGTAGVAEVFRSPRGSMSLLAKVLSTARCAEHPFPGHPGATTSSESHPPTTAPKA